MHFLKPLEWTFIETGFYLCSFSTFPSSVHYNTEVIPPHSPMSIHNRCVIEHSFHLCFLVFRGIFISKEASVIWLGRFISVSLIMAFVVVSQMLMTGVARQNDHVTPQGQLVTRGSWISTLTMCLVSQGGYINFNVISLPVTTNELYPFSAYRLFCLIFHTGAYFCLYFYLCMALCCPFNP